jgi:ribosomal protein S18 acetylase RimI-like enzyme
LFVRRARLEDDGAFVAKVGGETLARFGDYEKLLPEWMERSDISTWVAMLDGRAVGFTLLGAFCDPLTGRYADLLAIAVEPQMQAQGVGRLLPRHALRTSASGFSELRLSVAQTNLPARKLFEAEGFSYIDRELGTYSQGQLALRMSCRL